MTYQTPDETAAPVARAYVYQGEWVADCPRAPDPVTRKGCSNVEFLFRQSRMSGPRDLMLPFFGCSYCGQQAVIDWPRHRDELMAVLSVRPVPDTRNWYPSDHPVAVNWRLPHGQSVKDLMAENEEHGVSNKGVPR
jgi:hypothetical protein